MLKCPKRSEDIQVADPISPDFDYGLDGGPVPGANYEVNVDSPTSTQTHFTISYSQAVRSTVGDMLISKVNK